MDTVRPLYLRPSSAKLAACACWAVANSTKILPKFAGFDSGAVEEEADADAEAEAEAEEEDEELVAEAPEEEVLGG